VSARAFEPAFEPAGLDLVQWYPDIRPLVLRKFGAWIREQRLDPDDVVQETARKVLVANMGSHPFERQRCSPAVYILVAARSVIGHMVETRRRWDREVLDSTAEVLVPEELSSSPLDSLSEELSYDEDEQPIVRLYLEGHRISEIVALLQAHPKVVARIIAGVRERARRYP
jgi:DNA-directed RNA polymerase specialized sigma24 family protein